jgi:hypothetical protein
MDMNAEEQRDQVEVLRAIRAASERRHQRRTARQMWMSRTCGLASLVALVVGAEAVREAQRAQALDAEPQPRLALEPAAERAVQTAPVPEADRTPRQVEPETPSDPLSKQAFLAGVNAIKGKVAECHTFYGESGLVMVDIVVGRSGRVSAAFATGRLAGTPVASCVERAVLSASFPPSSGLSTPYPFILK